ncbi:hypothetical protein UA38_03440 [Photobacterium kishitanii]|uniref:YnhF family membrane protein n=1 Tax=Photobacterium kishitanii TaxID=318456 RepID=A0AAX0YS76_9GAMM|nr:hypothetical protein UB40_08965 [Photobacterium kishitanii]KJG59377.1 hypothetical protein UA38_03440 [Photobacterium kishitanii]KJG62371.1 hypothetical protein UA42_05780 [Photobacterium kishitanii]KJG67528.1 hypothetical protein UA40_03440 [Photobacterium kishitanii]KJG70195.1 hypothetical protein UA41_07320 [Photobacterium kishitanii]
MIIFVIIVIDIDFLNNLTIDLSNIIITFKGGFVMNIELKIALVVVTVTLFTIASYGLVALHA